MANGTLSICIPTFNRAEMTINAFIDVYFDSRVEAVVIVDDASTDDSFEKLQKMAEVLPKVVLHRQAQNRDCYFNKYSAVAYSPTRFCILLDSDNKIDKSYLDKIFEHEWGDDVILTPDFAKPHFDFRAYSGLSFTKENIAEYIDKPMFEVMCNAANYFVCKQTYCEVFDKETDPVTSDSIYQIYNWLKAGYKIKCVEGLQYDHAVHSGSHYQNNVHRTAQGFHESILQKLRELK